MGEHSIKMASCVFCPDNLQSEGCFASDDDEYVSVFNDANDEDGDYLSKDIKTMMHMMMIQMASCVFCSGNLQSRSTVKCSLGCTINYGLQLYHKL